MSWPSTYPPPPRRSGSRSPRGSYPPREAAYPQDYRGDWEHDRWDRAAYDYPRRARSRSPGAEDIAGGRKRRRSPSPFERDRYDPRPRYNDDYDTHSRGGYGYSPPRRGPPPRRQPPDPRAMDYPASLKQYADWFRFFFPEQAQEEDNADKVAEIEAGDGSKPRNGIKSKWEKYKKEFAATQLQTMFEHHRKSPWFAEKYDPATVFQDLRLRLRKEGWKGRAVSFLNELELGKFDPDARDEATTDGVNGDGEERKPDDDLTMEVDEETADAEKGDLANGRSAEPRRGLTGEMASVMHEGNQIMIRTIPPDIGRLKIEAACASMPGYVYLALGDPLQKRNYYRAGWIRFSDDTDMEQAMVELTDKKIDGFKLHVTHTTRPFTTKMRTTPDVASRPERLVKDLATIKILASLLEDQATTLRKFKPSPVTTEDPENIADQPDGTMRDDELEEEEPAERGSDAVDRRIEKVMSDLREQGLVDVNDEVAYEAKKTVVSLDLYIAYLRNAYNTCFYCCVVTDHVEELHRKCVKHVRKPLPVAEPNGTDDVKDPAASPAADKDIKKDGRNRAGDGRGDERWLEWLDSKLALLTNRDGVEPRDYGGKNYDEELSKAVEPHIKREDEGKFRCKACLKLFKATSFVEKHIANKHPEHVKALDDLNYFNNFALDPHRIQPFAHPPANTGGGSSQAPPQAFGISVNNREYHDRESLYVPQPSWDAQSRRSDSRRLSDRITGAVDGGVAAIPMSAGLPAKPPGLDQALQSNNGNRRRGPANASGMPPPPPADAKEDPRAAAGRRVSYHDMDLVAEGDVELSY